MNSCGILPRPVLEEAEEEEKALEVLSAEFGPVYIAATKGA